MMLYDHPPIVHQAIAALNPTSLIKEIKTFYDRVELYLEDGQVLTQYTLHPPAVPPPPEPPTLSGAEGPGAEERAEASPSTAARSSVPPPPSVKDGGGREGAVPTLAEPVEASAGAGAEDLSSLPMHALRSLASDLAVTFTNKTTKKDLIALISAARSSVPPPPSVKDGGGREGAVE